MSENEKKIELKSKDFYQDLADQVWKSSMPWEAKFNMMLRIKSYHDDSSRSFAPPPLLTRSVAIKEPPVFD
jgi:hypothetical protein